MKAECPICKVSYGRRKGYAVQCKKCGTWLKSDSEKKTYAKGKYYRSH